MPPEQPPLRQSSRFLFLYALAWAGGSVAYVPFLSLLLPDQVSMLADTRAVYWLASLTFIGAVAASVGNIAAGYLSDITRNRRLWVITGLALSTVLLVMIGRLETFPLLVAAIICWQVAINMILGPLAAWAGDTVPDAQKGSLGGMMAFAPAAGAVSGAIVTIPGLASREMQFVLVAAMVIACILPLLLFGSPRPVKIVQAAEISPEKQFRAAVSHMWLARLLIQISEATLFAFLLYWFRSIDPDFSTYRAAHLLSVVLLITAPAALMIGRWADRRARPIFPLQASAVIAAGALLVMGLSKGLDLAIVGYIVFGISTNIFLALHSAQTLRVLPRSDRRGRDLGFFNLTNTVPSLLMPGLALAMVPTLGFQALFLVLAVLALIACALLMTLTRQR